MLFIFRVILVVIYCVMMCILGCLYCLFSPHSPKHVATLGRLFGRLSPVFGLKMELRKPADAESYDNAIYTANHQNNYGMMMTSNIAQPPTVTVGKKGLLWIPLFGRFYWLTGNLLIGRNNWTKAYGTTAEMMNTFKKRKISFWMFPEGTCSYGRGLLPFKTGAFHTAIAAGVPVIPACVSNISNKIKLNRWNNSLVIIEMLLLVDTSQFSKDNMCALATCCRELIAAKITELDNEVAVREAAKKSWDRKHHQYARTAGGKRIPFFICQYVMKLICHSVGVSLLRLSA